jgi:hypothetical protein
MDARAEYDETTPNERKLMATLYPIKNGDTLSITVLSLRWKNVEADAACAGLGITGVAKRGNMVISIYKYAYV